MQKVDYEKLLKTIQKNIATKNLLITESVNDIKESLDETCSLLRIARIETVKAITGKKDDAPYQHGIVTCYEHENFDSEKCFVTGIFSTTFVDAKYIFYQFKGDEPFTYEEKQCMNLLAHYLFLISSNILVSKYLKFSVNHDKRFSNVYNENFLQNKVSEIIEKGNIGNFGIVQYNIIEFNQINRKFGENTGTKILEKYHDGLRNIIGNDPDKDGFDSALGGDHGFAIFRIDLKEKVLSYLDSAEFTEMTPKGKIERIIISSRYGYTTKIKGCTTSHTALSQAGIAFSIVRKKTNLRSLEFDENQMKKIELERKIESWYENALKNEEFLVYYQPKIGLHKYELIGAEALVRWMHDGKMVYPDQFIPILEANLTIKELDKYMLEHVCRDMRKWLEEGKNVPQISINLSRATLGQENLVDVITSIIDSYGIPHFLIQIELTESASDKSNDELKPLVEGLNGKGINTAVDDFGTGFSSLSLIKELPWDVLKIDKSLLQGSHKDGSRDQLMFKSIISMAQTMGLECIVEGVETKDDVKILKESGCYMAQGYYFSKPKPKEEFKTLLDGNE